MKISVSIAQARRQDIPDIVARSPEADNPLALRTVEDWFMRSLICFTGMANGQIACMWGVIVPTMMSDQPAYLWLVTTDLINEHKFIFVRHSQMVVKELLKDFPVIQGHCLVSQPISIRWLRWLGAKFFDEIQGTDGTWFLPFELRANHV